MVFESYNDKKMKKSTKIVSLITAVALLCIAVYIKSIYTGLVGGLILLALGFGKTTVINEEGLLVTYSTFFFTHKELWPYSDITDIHQEAAPDPKYVVLHFGKGVMVRRLVFPAKSIRDILELATSVNPNIHVDDI